MVCHIAVWNAEFRTPSSSRGSAIRDVLTARNVDIICLTDAYGGNLPPGGHTLCSGADYGYGTSNGRRKVLLWSREPWTGSDSVGDVDLPPGRFVLGVTRTAIGELTVMGVCIPWKDAHVRTGSRDRQPWEDHLKYLHVLDRVIQRTERTRVVVAGDWNQRVPQYRAPQHTADALQWTFRNMSIATAGPLGPLQRRSIDHLAHTTDLSTLGVVCWSEYDRCGQRLTDHFGLEVTLGPT